MKTFDKVIGWLVVLAVAILVVTPFVAETKMTVVKVYGTVILLIPILSLICVGKDTLANKLAKNKP